MSLEALFSQALGIESPWIITGVAFDSVKKRLDIKVDFSKGSTFSSADASTGDTKEYKAYDTVEKTWRHLNFFLITHVTQLQFDDMIIIDLSYYDGG